MIKLFSIKSRRKKRSSKKRNSLKKRNLSKKKNKKMNSLKKKNSKKTNSLRFQKYKHNYQQFGMPAFSGFFKDGCKGLTEKEIFRRKAKYCVKNNVNCSYDNFVKEGCPDVKLSASESSIAYEKAISGVRRESSPKKDSPRKSMSNWLTRNL